LPSTINDIFAAVGLTPAGAVRWDTPIPAASPGVYAVSLSNDPAATPQSNIQCLIDPNAIQQWLNVCPALSLDGQRPVVAALSKRIAEFWLPDEHIVYIGLAGTNLRSRVHQYYRTPIGARKPHAGGYFLKAIRNLSDLFVHYAPTGDPSGCEQKMLQAFCKNVSATTKSILRDPGRPFPFANLEHPPGTRKAHGLKGTRVH